MKQNLVESNMEILNKNRDEFQQTFKIPLTRFMHPLFGFDIVAFDTWLGTPDGISTADYLLRIYGEAGVSLIEGLL